MLFITRYENQSFFIGDNIKITIVKNPKPNSSAVCIGIDAPGMLILREEIKGSEHAYINIIEEEK